MPLARCVKKNRKSLTVHFEYTINQEYHNSVHSLTKEIRRNLPDDIRDAGVRNEEDALKTLGAFIGDDDIITRFYYYKPKMLATNRSSDARLGDSVGHCVRQLQYQSSDANERPIPSVVPVGPGADPLANRRPAALNSSVDRMAISGESGGRSKVSQF